MFPKYIPVFKSMIFNSSEKNLKNTRFLHTFWCLQNDFKNTHRVIKYRFTNYIVLNWIKLNNFIFINNNIKFVFSIKCLWVNLTTFFLRLFLETLKQTRNTIQKTHFKLNSQSIVYIIKMIHTHIYTHIHMHYT